MTASDKLDRLRQWYLARLRKNALEDAVGASTLTPGSLIEADRGAIESLVASKVGPATANSPSSSMSIANSRTAIVLTTVLVLSGLASGFGAFSPIAVLIFAMIIAMALMAITLQYEHQLTMIKAQLSPALPSSSPNSYVKTDGWTQLASKVTSENFMLNQRLNLIADYSSQVVCTFDKELTITAISPSVSKAWNISPLEVLGKSLESLITVGDLNQMQNALIQDGDRRTEIFFDGRLRLGYDREVETRWTVEWSAREQSYFAVIEDISAEKELERLRNEFVVVISHDLRTPLSAIKWTLQLLLEGVYGKVSDQGERRIHESLESSEFLLDMIADLLDLHRLDVAQPQLRYCDAELQTLVNESIRAVSSLAAAKNITIDNHVLPVSCALDEIRIKRVFVNLLSNAIKFSPDNSSVDLHSSFDDNFLSLTITDEGKGITPEAILHLFSRFSPTSSPQSRRDGSGLGLFVSKALVEAHGGTIVVASEVGRGASF